MPEPESTSPDTRWAALTGGTGGREYAARFAALAAQGRDMHGEADFCAALVEPGARVLDAGCGTGRVAIRLVELGFDCVGVDVDESMLEVAREAAPEMKWVLADLEDLDLAGSGDDERFDLVVVAGNVIPLLAEGAVAAAVARLGTHLSRGGLLVAGFGLDAAHLPAGCPVTPLPEYDAACAAAGLALVERYSTWAADPFTESAGYAVSVHRPPGPGRRFGFHANPEHR